MQNRSRAQPSACHLALLGIVLALPVTPSIAQPEEEVYRLEEIVVTALRRGEESLLDVPMSVSVIGSDTIEKRGLVEMDDYLRELPSTQFLDRGAGRNSIVIRGITADAQGDGNNVGSYFGEAPVTRFGTASFGSTDVKLVDIARIEVLRGPQGTLYGDGSMGGTVRIIPAPADLYATSASVSAGYSATGGTGGDDHRIEGTLNLPLAEDEIAVRIVAFRHENSGFYQNVAGSDPDRVFWGEVFGAPVRDQDDIGASTYTGARVQLLWQPNDRFGLTLMALTQDIEQTGIPEAELAYGDYQQARYGKFGGGGEGLENDFDLINALMEYDFGDLSLLSSTSFLDTTGSWDLEIGPVAGNFGFGGPIPVFQAWQNDYDRTVQELRLKSRQDRRFRYLLGLYFQQTKGKSSNTITFEGDPALNPFGDPLMYRFSSRPEEEQLALFGDLSFDFSDRLSGSVGVRFYDYEQDFPSTEQLFFLNQDAFDSRLLNEDDGNSFSLSLDHAFSNSTLFYGRFAEGFRLGGPHPDLPDSICDVDGDGIIDGTDVPEPTRIAPDDLDSYEVGTKLHLADGRVMLNATAFSVDWSGLPIGQFAPCGAVYTLNAGAADSRGAEIEGTVAITPDLTANFSASWVDAELSKDAPFLGSDGDRLPGTPRYNLTVGLQNDFHVAGRPAFFRIDAAYVDEYYNNLQETGLPAGGFTTLDLRGGLSFDNLDLQLFVDNVTDELGRTWIDSGFGLGRNHVSRPRTFGLQLSYHFDGG